jgi:hypothetical protein
MKQCRTSSSFRFLWFLFVLLIRAVATERDASSSSSSSLRFVALGDWGGNEHRTSICRFRSRRVAQRSVAAKALAKHVRQDAVRRFVHVAGRQFLSVGRDRASTIARFNATFERVYDDRGAARRCRGILWLATMTTLGSIEAQLAYSRRSSRWRFPREFYVETVCIWSQSVAGGVIFLDCTLFQAQWMRRPFAFVNRRSTATCCAALEQRDWLNRTLEATRDADWLMRRVPHANHVGGRVRGPPAHDSRTCMPLLEQYGAAVLRQRAHAHAAAPAPQPRQLCRVGLRRCCQHRIAGIGSTCPSGSLRFCWPRRARAGKQDGFTKQTRRRLCSRLQLHDATTASMQIHRQCRPARGSTSRRRSRIRAAVG